LKEALLSAAREARENAYAPYSGYKVGAAVLAESGNIYSGCNVENGVYPLGQCAERGAIQNMVASGDLKIVALLLATQNASTPCGACRQVISEFADSHTPIYIADTDGIVEETTVGALLPKAFKLQ
jgi:cytidine deaminase